MEAFQSFTLCPSNGLSTTNKENEPSTVPLFLQDKNRSVVRPIQESSVAEVKRVIRASPFEDVVHKRNLPKSGTISPLNSEEYLAWKAGLKREESLNHMSTPHGTRKRRNTLSDSLRRAGGVPVPPWPLREENDSGSWKAKFLRSEISRTQLSTNLMTTLEENRKLRIKTMRLEAALVQEQERARNYHHFHRTKAPSARSNKGTQTSEINLDIGNKPGLGNSQDIKCETTSPKSVSEDKSFFEETNESSQTMEGSSLTSEREAIASYPESGDSCSATQATALRVEKNFEGGCSVTEDRSKRIDSLLVLDTSQSSSFIRDNVVDTSLCQVVCREKNDSGLAASPDNKRETCENDAPVSEQDESNSKGENNEINPDSEKEMNSFQINSRRGCRGLPTSPDDESVSIVFGQESPELATQARMTRSRSKQPKHSIEAGDYTNSNALLEDTNSKLNKSSGEEKAVYGERTTRSRAKKNRADAMLDSIDCDNLSLSPIEKETEDGEFQDMVSNSKHEDKENCSTDKQKKIEFSLFANFQAPALKRRRRLRR